MSTRRKLEEKTLSLSRLLQGYKEEYVIVFNLHCYLTSIYDLCLSWLWSDVQEVYHWFCTHHWLLHSIVLRLIEITVVFSLLLLSPHVVVVGVVVLFHLVVVTDVKTCYLVRVFHVQLLHHCLYLLW